MAAARTVLDGAHDYGCQDVTIDARTFIGENIQISRAVSYADDMDALGNPVRRRATAGRDTISMTVQLATNSTAYPQAGQTVVVTVDSAGYGAETFVLDPPGHEESNDPGEIRKLKLTGWKKIGTVTTVA